MCQCGHVACEGVAAAACLVHRKARISCEPQTAGIKA